MKAQILKQDHVTLAERTAAHLASLRLTPGYDHALHAIRTALEHMPLVGPSAYQRLTGLKRGLKDVLSPQVLFEDLGLKYVGPVDGHDEQAVEHALRLHARDRVEDRDRGGGMRPAGA